MLTDTRDMIRFLIPAAVLSIVTGYCVGATTAAWTVYPSSPMQMVDDETVSDTPVVRINGIRNGTLVGSVSGDVRLVAGSNPVEVTASGGFTITDRTVLTNIIEVHVPLGMKFVASKKGKKYYPVGSVGGNQIVPQNRVYFPTEASAQKAGYTR
jgi:hypothetical protein